MGPIGQISRIGRIGHIRIGPIVEEDPEKEKGTSGNMPDAPSPSISTYSMACGQP
jgi:hypothetical protein